MNIGSSQFKVKNYNWLVILMIVLFFMMPINALADGGDGTGGGTGDGSGGGQASGLYLVSASPKTGSSDVPLDVIISLEFSNNVVNLAVKDHNKQCFSMADDSGKTIPITIVMGDDQVNKNVKKYISIVPAESLLAGTTYTLTISENLSAKNGKAMSKDERIVFSTVKLTQESSGNIEALKPNEDENPSSDTDNDETEDNAADNDSIDDDTIDSDAVDNNAIGSDVADDNTMDGNATDSDTIDDNAPDNNRSNAMKYIVIACVILAAVIITVLIVSKRKNK